MTSRSNHGRNVPAGGPATVNGVLYQLLWSLLQASRARVASKLTMSGNQAQGVTLILEPIGGGGDLVIRSGSRRIVQQLKARANGGPWSLQEVVQNVIPDLYLAAVNDTTSVDFEFVTEGRMGDWNDVYVLFQSLRNRPCPTSDPLSDLDNVKAVSFGREALTAKRTTAQQKPPFWGAESYTERTLFDRIVEEVRKRRSIEKNESIDETRRKLRSVLGNLHFRGERSMAAVQAEIDHYLAAVIDRIDDIATLRNSLAIELAKRATAGSAVIDCAAFFKENGLNATALNDWMSLRSSAQSIVATHLRHRGYDRLLDVRIEAARQMLSSWPATAPVLAITGESGYGKSWRAFAACREEQDSPNVLSIAVSARETCDSTLSRVADLVWLDIAGHDAAIPIARIARRVREVLGPRSEYWLTVYIDGAIDDRQAKDLLIQRWEEWGIRVAMTVAPAIAADLESQSRGRCVVVRVDEFTTPELHGYLTSCLDDQWPQMPEFVRNQLRVPLLVSMFRQLVEGELSREWTPNSEYQLFAAFWDRAQRRNPTDALVLLRLTERFLDGDEYPWTLHQVHEAGFDHQTADRLEQIGWLRILRGGTLARFEIPHRRLLNWLVAIVLLERINKDNGLDESSSAELRSFLIGNNSRHGSQLGFVPMDILWLACRDQMQNRHGPKILTALDEGHRQCDEIYRKLVPTLGEAAIPALEARLRTANADSYKSRRIAEAIGRIGGNQAVKVGIRLLTDEVPFNRLAAAWILQQAPSKDALEGLWRLHAECELEPERFLREHEDRHILYRPIFAGLRACCVVAPQWLEKQIEIAAPDREPVHDLVYLLANLGGDYGAPIWQRQKSRLFQVVAAERRRSLAQCINVFSDRSEIDWLVANVGTTEDLLGPMCLRALARLSPGIAIESLQSLPSRILEATRSWFSDLLFALSPVSINQSLYAMLHDASSPERWEIAGVFLGHTALMDVQSLTLLLDDLEQGLAKTLSINDRREREAMFGPIRLLATVNSRTLLEHLQGRRGTPLESRLLDLIVQIGPRVGLDRHSLVLDEALKLLYRINGDAFTEAVNLLLRAPSRYGRLDGMELAWKRPNDVTQQLLTKIVHQTETWDGYYLEQLDAAEILGALGCWEPVIELVRQLARMVSTDVTDLARHGMRPPRAVLCEAVDRLKAAPDAALAGDVLALGFGDGSYAQIIREVATRCDATSETAWCCAIALDMLGDETPESVPFLYQQLGVPEHNFSATNALISNGTPEALDALADFYKNELSGAVALNLIASERHADAAKAWARDFIIAKIQSESTWGLPGEMAQLCLRNSDTIALKEILSHPAIDDFLRQEAFADEGPVWHSGQKAYAIRCLAVLDPHAAALAVKASLRNVESYDREMYPPLLAELCGDTAVEVLLQLFAAEKEDRVASAIGRTLTEVDVDEHLTRWFESSEAADRESACRVAKWAKMSDRVSNCVQGCLADLDESVADAAATAMMSLRARQEVVELGHALIESSSDSERWLYLDCMLDLADPGDLHHKWPLDGPAIDEVLSPFQIRYATKKLEKRRKK